MSEQRKISRTASNKRVYSASWRALATLVAFSIATLAPCGHANDIAVTQNESTQTLALLIGIDQYAPGKFSPPALSGCTNDVARMRAVLLERFGFDEDGIRVLLNEEATHEAIVRSFDEHLLQRANANSKVVVYVSGHGSRIPDKSGERSAEPDGFDSTFLAYDSRAAELNGEHDVSDDELRSLLTVLTKLTDHVVVITDTCHSGGVLRGEHSARSAPMGRSGLDEAWLREFWPDDVPLIEDGVDVGLSLNHYVHVAAAERDQLAWELELPNEAGEIEQHGAMTYFLVEALDRANPESTWREIIDDTAVRVAVQRFQTVNHLGNVDREIFGGDFKAVRGFKAEAKGKSLLIRAGALVGLRIDSILEVSASDGTQLGQAKIVKATPSAARAEWVGQAPDPMPDGALRVLEISRGSGTLPLRVRLDLESCELPDDPAFLQIVGEAEQAEYVLEERKDGLYLRTTEGVVVHDSPIPIGEGLSEALEEAAREESRWRALCELTAERGQRPINVSIRTTTEAEANKHAGYAPAFELPSPSRSESGSALRVLAGFPPNAGLPSRSLVIMELENPYDIDLYVSVLSLEESRKRSVVFPTNDRSVLIPAGTKRDCKISILARDEWQLERFMQDRYLVIAWDKPFDLRQFERKGQDRSHTTVAPELLTQVLKGSLTRGSRTEVSYRGWGLSTVNVLVKMPPRGK